MAGKKALVTGGAGFIGSHLVERLIKDGYSVHVIDDLSTGSFDNIAYLEGDPGFAYTIDTVLDLDVMEKLVDDCDVVFHLAAAVGVEYVIESNLKSMQINIRGTDNVLELANRGKKKVIVFSSSEVYGKSSEVPFSEEDDTILGATTVTRWSYAVSKAVDEIMALAYFRERNLPVVIVRLFNTCGPRQTGKYGMVVPRFVKQSLLGNPITVYGDGSQSRCFASVFDVVDGIMALHNSDAALGRVFNVGNDQEVKVIDLAKRVKELTGSSSPIKFIPYEEAYERGFEDMMRRVPDLTRIRSTIDYHPRVTLSEIIQSVIEYYKS
jgi:UDP-glucose 4-epimerase